MASGEPRGSKEGSDAATNLPRGLLGKGGAPVSKSTRLPTVRAARDLTLGGAQRKQFKPTIPVRSKDSSQTGPIEDKLETKEKRPRRDRADKSPRGRGRGQSSSRTTIQSQSIFEQGPTERTIKRESIYGESGGSGGGGSGGGSSSRSSTSVAVKNIKQTKKETQEILDQLLRDDFIDDGDEIDITNQPVVLPLLDPVKDEKNKVSSSQVKPEPSKSVSTLSDPTLAAQVIDHKDESLKLVLVQLPDCMPGLMSDENDKSVKPKTEPTTQQQPSNTTESDISEKLSKQCTLKDLSDGKIGKIQITKSGKARLVLGKVIFDLNRGAACSFLQELVCVDAQSDNGKVSCLGPVKEKLVVVPNIDSLLK